MIACSTAVVHLANNIFKSILVGKKANWQVVLRFAVTGAISGFFGGFSGIQGAWRSAFLVKQDLIKMLL
jgi:hypothetical protein